MIRRMLAIAVRIHATGHFTVGCRTERTIHASHASTACISATGAKTSSKNNEAEHYGRLKEIF